MIIPFYGFCWLELSMPLLLWAGKWTQVHTSTVRGQQSAVSVMPLSPAASSALEWPCTSFHFLLLQFFSLPSNSTRSLSRSLPSTHTILFLYTIHISHFSHRPHGHYIVNTYTWWSQTSQQIDEHIMNTNWSILPKLLYIESCTQSFPVCTRWRKFDATGSVGANDLFHRAVQFAEEEQRKAGLHFRLEYFHCRQKKKGGGGGATTIYVRREGKIRKQERVISWW